MLDLLRSNVTPIPIDVSLNKHVHTFGHIFLNRNVL